MSRGETRPDSLAAQAAAWVPPWDRRRDLDPGPPLERPDAEYEADAEHEADAERAGAGSPPDSAEPDRAGNYGADHAGTEHAGAEHEGDAEHAGAASRPGGADAGESGTGSGAGSHPVPVDDPDGSLNDVGVDHPDGSREGAELPAPDNAMDPLGTGTSGRAPGAAADDPAAAPGEIVVDDPDGSAAITTSRGAGGGYDGGDESGGADGHGGADLPGAGTGSVTGAVVDGPASAGVEPDRPPAVVAAVDGPVAGGAVPDGPVAGGAVPDGPVAGGAVPDGPADPPGAEPGSAGGDGAEAPEAWPAADPLGGVDPPTGADLRAAIEAILLVVDEPVAEEVVAQVLDSPVATVSAALRDLADEYTVNRRGFELRRAAGGWRLYTRSEFAPYVERFVLDGQQLRLTQAALETLAVVAYKQPVTRSRIGAIRGVNSDGVVRTLVTRGLIEETGAEPETGAYLYRTTPLFLEKLGLNSVDELPPLAPFLPEDVDEVADAQR